jgi:hypothetical protein
MSSTFGARVNEQIDRLQRLSCRQIEAEVAQKRIAWVRRRYQTGGGPEQVSPRQAFELFFFDYLGILRRALFRRVGRRTEAARVGCCHVVAATGQATLAEEGMLSTRVTQLHELASKAALLLRR